MAHGQEPDFVFRRNGRFHLNRPGERPFSRLLTAELCASAVVMLDTPCSEVQYKTTGYPLHSHVSTSLPIPCVTVCHQVSTELYNHTTSGAGRPAACDSSTWKRMKQNLQTAGDVQSGKPRNKLVVSRKFCQRLTFILVLLLPCMLVLDFQDYNERYSNCSQKHQSTFSSTQKNFVGYLLTARNMS